MVLRLELHKIESVKWRIILVTNIKDKTGAHVVVRKHPSNNKLKVCSVEGTQNEIDSALKLIRDKFPIKRYPEVTLEQISFLPQVSTVSLVPDHLYVNVSNLKYSFESNQYIYFS
jgi:hypothetical protein